MPGRSSSSYWVRGLILKLKRAGESALGKKRVGDGMQGRVVECQGNSRSHRVIPVWAARSQTVKGEPKGIETPGICLLGEGSYTLLAS